MDTTTHSDSAHITDLYEAAYLLMRGCDIDDISCISVSETLACRIGFSGRALESSREEFASKRAVVNLHAFRRSYGQVNSLVHQAKKNYDLERRRMRRLSSIDSPDVFSGSGA